MEKRRIIYYTNELEDEFSRAQIKPRVIDGSYVYLHNSPWKRFTHFFWYRLVATPISTALFIPMPIYPDAKLPYLKRATEVRRERA